MRRLSHFDPHFSFRCSGTILRATFARCATGGLQSNPSPSVPTDEPPRKPTSEEDRWWPVDDKWTGRVRRNYFSSTKQQYQGMLVPELKEVPKPEAPELLNYQGESFFGSPELFLEDGMVEKNVKLAPPASFDPAIDEIEESDYIDQRVMIDIAEAAHHDRRRMEQLGNPLTVEDQLDYLMMPQRQGQEVQQQRSEFNGFIHWGLLYAATVALDQEQDTKRAHQFVNRFLRDIDLFEKWLAHPKVVAHMKKKFNVDTSGKLDKLIGIVASMYIRSKIQAVEADFSGALKSLVGAAGMLHEGGDLKKEKHRKMLGAVLACRGMIYHKLNSPERAEDDLTRALPYIPRHRCATVYQLRAECREILGRLDEAREDEERAADIWENAETIHPGMDHPPLKWVI